MKLNIAFWGKALRTIPRISKEEWGELDVISRWLVATRSGVLIMTAISALIGGLLAFADGSFNTLNFVVAFFGLNLAHASNNLINDWVDYKRGVDKNNYFRAEYGPQVLEHGYMSVKRFQLYVYTTLLLAMAAGAFLVLDGPLTVLYLGAAGLFFLLFYTWPLKYIGLGEPTVVLVWGPLMIGGTYFVSGGYHWSWEVTWLAVLYAIGPTSVIFGKHIDTIERGSEKEDFHPPGHPGTGYLTVCGDADVGSSIGWIYLDGDQRSAYASCINYLARIALSLDKGQTLLQTEAGYQTR